MSSDDIRTLAKLIKEKEQILEFLEQERIENYRANFVPYEFQREFMQAGTEYKDRRLMAGNRVGKTFIIGFELSLHLTGDYPDWWDGYRFNRPIYSWAMGPSNEQIREVYQRILFGKLMPREPQFVPDKNLIPFVRGKEIKGILRNPQSPANAKEVYVHHKSGGFSTVIFKAYEQSEDVMMGPEVDFISIDEDPRNQKIITQAKTRLLTGNGGKGGHLACTFTPEKGWTDQVVMLLRNKPSTIYFKRATWNDAPHMTAKNIEEILKEYPEYEREMRSKGLPMMGQGKIFRFGREEYRYKDTLFANNRFPDHYRHIVGHDFGWDHPQAWVFMAYDPDRDIIYVYKTIRISKKTPAEMYGIFKRARCEWIPIAWPHDGLQHEKGSGEELRNQYSAYGLNMLPERATFEESGGSLVSPGLTEITDRVKERRLLVAESCEELFDEMDQYHMNNGKIVKEHDDLIDAMRYGMMMIRFAEQRPRTISEIQSSIRRSQRASGDWY
jgi:phage terminase large subunit-like protein